MPIKRARDIHLYNHCKQLNKPSDLRLTFVFIQDYKGDLTKIDSPYIYWDNSWICELSFSDENLNYSYISCQSSKKKSKLIVIQEAETDLLRIIT